MTNGPVFRSALGVLHGHVGALAIGLDGDAVTAGGERTNVSVQNAQGGPENGAVGQRIVGLLVDDLK